LCHERDGRKFWCAISIVKENLLETSEASIDIFILGALVVGSTVQHVLAVFSREAVGMYTGFLEYRRVRLRYCSVKPRSSSPAPPTNIIPNPLLQKDNHVR
jgi:hypothetical protein